MFDALLMVFTEDSGRSPEILGWLTGNPHPYPSLAVRARNGRVADNSE
jgi:hypothetical protein